MRDHLEILSATKATAEVIPVAPEYCGNCGIWDQLHLLPNGKIVAVNPCGVWLLDMPAAATAPTTRAAESPVHLAAGETSIEIESFKLTNGRIEPLPGASGGKVVRLDPVTGRAFQIVELSAGRYEFLLHAACAKLEEPGARLLFDFEYSNGGRNTWLSCSQTNQIARWSPLIHEMKSAGQLKLLLSSSHSDTLFDRLVIRPLP